LLTEEAGDLLARLHTSLTHARSRLLPERREPAEACVLLVEGLLQHLRPELGQRALQVPASQAARGRCVLQHGLLALAHERLQEGALLDSRDGLLLGLGALQPEHRLHALERWSSGLDVGLQQLAHLVKLTALLLDAGLRGVGLLACGFARSAGLHGAAEQARPGY
jgi:hypothetical protein